MEIYSIGSSNSSESCKPDQLSRFKASKIGSLLQDQLNAGEISKGLFDRISKLTETIKSELVEAGVERALEEGDLRPAVVMKKIRDVRNEDAPKYNFCTAGKTAIELGADGSYSRCPKQHKKGNKLGNLLEDGMINTISLDTEADCNLRCAKFMCFARNTIRTNTREEFDSDLSTLGLRGNYENQWFEEKNKSEIFIRWKLTETCNYTCSYCSAWKTVNQKRYEIPTDRMLEVARKFTDQFDNISLRLTGGEPSVKKNYVELMQFLNDRLDKFTDIEVRTNFSFPEKQKSVFAMNWQGKLHYHVGCHVYDKNFRPWDFVDVLSRPHEVNYVLKFVSTDTNQKYVDNFINYFLENGIEKKRIKVIHDIRNTAGDPNKVPPAFITMQSMDNGVLTG